MTQKIGRNDPCSCGSGKKYKNCCLSKQGGKKKLTAKWLNAPSGPNLIERTFGNSIDHSKSQFAPVENGAGEHFVPLMETSEGAESADESENPSKS